MEELDTSYQAFLSQFERALLSIGLHSIPLLLELQQKITVDYFLFPPHKIIYVALSNLISQPKVAKIDLEALIIECDKLGLKNFGVSNDYLVLLSEGGFDVANFPFYFSKVKDAFIKHSLYRYLQKGVDFVQKNAADKETNIQGDTLLEMIGSDITKLFTTHAGKVDGVEFSAYVDDFLKRVQENPTSVRGLRTGFTELDEAINGLMPGTLTVIAGRHKVGKSTVMLNIVDHVAIQSGMNLKPGEEDPTVPVLLISTEMNKDEDMARLLAIRTLEKERHITNGIAFQDPKIKAKLLIAAKQVKDGAKIHHIFMPDFNATKVCNTIYHYWLKYKIGLAVFDYIKMETDGGNDKVRREEHQVLGDLTTALKNMAGKLGIPILAGCQLGRHGDVADSDRIKRYANTVIEFKWKTLEELEEMRESQGEGAYHKYGTHWFYIATARSGATNNKIPVRFWTSCLKLQEAEHLPEADGGDTLPRLTIPSEWERIKEKLFVIETVNDVVQNNDAQDIRVSEVPYDDPNF